MEGVIINGTCWATCNVDRPGTFAKSPEDSGMFFQGNCKTGWPPIGDISSIESTAYTHMWPSSYNGYPGHSLLNGKWREANDPSPVG